MSSTAACIQQVARDHLDVSRDLELDATVGDSDLFSVDATVSFKVLGQEFGREIQAENLAQFKTL